MTTLKEAAAMALDALESLQGGCTDSNDGTVEAITVWCPEVIEALRAALSAPADVPALPDAVDHYGLIDERSPADRAKLAAQALTLSQWEKHQSEGNPMHTHAAVVPAPTTGEG